jgi:predicted Zn finger-like uncharacterized protein
VYTQCSNCETVFKLSADVLRAAGGQVRCGRCGEVFSALARLAENASAFATGTGESPQDLEERAASILESPTHAPQGPATEALDDHAEGGEIAHLEVLDFSFEDLGDMVDPPGSEAASFEAPRVGTTKAEPPKAALEEPSLGDNSMEFTLPPGELDRIFVESKSGVPPPFPIFPPAQEKPAAVRAPHKEATPAAEDVDDGPLPDIEVVRDNRISSAGGLLVSDFARQQLQATLDPAEFDLGKRPSPLANSFKLWLGAAVVGALLLSAQMVHHNREWLATHGPLGPLLRSWYSTMGSPVAAPASLAAYQLRQWGVTGDPGADGTLKVRASILNNTAQLVPYPLLRVTLANRYGGRVGARDFEPSEYLGKPNARLLAPGERVDATLQILDPGKDAEGFEIDVCLRGTDRKVICANDVAPPQVKS